jgi:hypothetical protein
LEAVATYDYADDISVLDQVGKVTVRESG